jgi:zinc protease
VEFQSKSLLAIISKLLCVLACAIGLGLCSTNGYAQTVGIQPPASENQADLSLLPGPITQTPPAGLRVQTPSSSTAWPWETTGETPDPSIRFGRLENGMRYAIQRGKKPEKKEVALLFRYEVGSNYEEDNQLGYAHFLEHMAFNGSANVPEGEFVKRMERLGAAFGRHVNASTSNDATTYQFDLPSADEGRLELALDLLRETADRLTLSQDAIDREKGVVASELITRNSPARERYLEREKQLYPRMRSTNRSPIGTVQSINNVTSQSLRAFYQRWYRPERAILVIVGAVDVEATEAMIKERFVSWKPALDEPNPPKPSEGQWEENKLSVHIDRADGEREEFIIQSERPDPRIFDTGSGDEAILRDFVQVITFNIINSRLGKAATRGDASPYLSGSYGGPFAGPGNAPGLGWRAQMDFEPRNGDWRGGMKAIALEMRQILRDGFSQQDRDRAVANMSREYPDSDISDIFDTSAMVASSLMFSLSSGATPRAQKDRAIRRAERLRQLEKITVERLNEEVRFYWRGIQPRFLITTQDPSVTEASVIAAWREALAAPIPPRQVERIVRFEPLKMGSFGRLAGRWREPGLDAHFVRFENGVTLVVKPNPTPVADGGQPKRPGEVAVSVQLGAGWLAFGDGDGVWPAITNAEWQRGGFANLNATDLEAAFTDTSLAPIRTEFGFARARMSVESLQRDLNPVLDVMLAKLVAPRLGTDSIGLYADRLRQGLRRRQQTADSVFRQRRASLYQIGSPLFAARTPDESLQSILGTNVAAANDKLRKVLSDAPVSVIMVGDIDLDSAIEAVASRFGALPKRRGLETGIGVARNWRFREAGGPTQVFQHEGDADQALVHLAWQIPNVPKGAPSNSLDLLRAVFEIRALDVVREAYGQSYSPSVATTPLPGYGDNRVLTVTAVVAPKDVASVEARIAAIAVELATNGPTEDEFSRARSPMLEAPREDCKTNACWVSTISDELTQRALDERDPSPWRGNVDYLPTLRSATRADMQALAQRYFVDSRLIKVHVLPKAQSDNTAAE